MKDFDAGFEGAEKGFPKTTGTADWPSEKNPLKDFDMGFKAKWGGYKVGGMGSIILRENTHTHTYIYIYIYKSLTCTQALVSLMNNLAIEVDLLTG